MRSISLIAVCACCLLGGCASEGSSTGHVLSGEAPVERVVSRGDEAALAGDFEAASLLYRQALRQEPSADLWYRLGAALIQKNEQNQAMWAFRSALELDPDHVDSLERISLYLTKKDQVAEARPYLERLLGLEPDNWRAHNALGVLADLEGRFDAAGNHYASAIERNPESPMLWNNLGFSYYLSGDFDGAMRTYLKALHLRPDYRPARHNIALVLARQSNYDAALDMMLSARAEAHAYSDVGYLAFRMGDYEIAERLLTEAIQRSGTYHRRAHQTLAAVRDAKAAAIPGR